MVTDDANSPGMLILYAILGNLGLCCFAIVLRAAWRRRVTGASASPIMTRIDTMPPEPPGKRLVGCSPSNPPSSLPPACFTHKTHVVHSKRSSLTASVPRCGSSAQSLRKSACGGSWSAGTLAHNGKRTSLAPQATRAVSRAAPPKRRSMPPTASRLPQRRVPSETPLSKDQEAKQEATGLEPSVALRSGAQSAAVDDFALGLAGQRRPLISQSCAHSHNEARSMGMASCESALGQCSHASMDASCRHRAILCSEATGAIHANGTVLNQVVEEDMNSEVEGAGNSCCEDSVAQGVDSFAESLRQLRDGVSTEHLTTWSPEHGSGNGTDGENGHSSGVRHESDASIDNAPPSLVEPRGVEGSSRCRHAEASADIFASTLTKIAATNKRVSCACTPPTRSMVRGPGLAQPRASCACSTSVSVATTVALARGSTSNMARDPKPSLMPRHRAAPIAINSKARASVIGRDPFAHQLSNPSKEATKRVTGMGPKTSSL